jgi:hypothetical protein
MGSHTSPVPVPAATSTPAPPYTIYRIDELLSSSSPLRLSRDEFIQQLIAQIHESFDTYHMEEPNDTAFGYAAWDAIVKEGIIGNKNRRTLVAVHDVTHEIIGSVSADAGDDIVGMGE